METTVNKYEVHFSAVPLLSGGFVGLATQVWDEGFATTRQTREFTDWFATAAEAERYAREQTLMQRNVSAVARRPYSDL
jgi:hypothetical protein